MNRFFISTLVLLMAVSSNAYAYLDPGTGSMLMQSLIGVIAAASMTASLFWGRIKIAFYKFSGKSSASKPDEDSPEK